MRLTPPPTANTFSACAFSKSAKHESDQKDHHIKWFFEIQKHQNFIKELLFPCLKMPVSNRKISVISKLTQSGVFSDFVKNYQSVFIYEISFCRKAILNLKKPA